MENRSLSKSDSGGNGNYKIVVVIQKARNIAAKGMINPFVMVELLEDKRKSQVAQKTQNPVWEESFEFSLPENKANASIFFTINDYNVAKGSDDFLGQVKISLLALVDEAKKIGSTLDKENWYPLSKLKANEKISGDLKIRLQIFPPSQVGDSSPRSTMDIKLESPVNGVYIVHKPREWDLDIIFVHGFTGNHIDTWCNLEHSIFWPQAWLARDMSTARIICIRYEPDISIDKGYLENRARHLASNLSPSVLEIGKTPIIFIAHSIGGLIIKQLLTQLDNENFSNEYYKILKQTIGVMFFGTPHRASKLSVLANHYLKNTPQELIQEFTNPEKLEGLDKAFRKIVKKTRSDNDGWIQVCAFGETLPINRTGFERITPVDSNSSKPDYGVWDPVDCNHLQITTPLDDQEMVYVKCREFIRKIAKEAKEVKKDGYDKLQEVSANGPHPPMGKKATLNDIIEPVSGEPIGYVGLIERPAAEKKLQGTPIGSFLIRWSTTTHSYVLSYVGKDKKFVHIAHIRPANGAINVITERGPEQFRDLHDFVGTMKKNGIISTPIDKPEYIFVDSKK